MMYDLKQNRGKHMLMALILFQVSNIVVNGISKINIMRRHKS
jgi:hypothetical protein